jgi:hypothetical protein
MAISMLFFALLMADNNGATLSVGSMISFTI